MIERASVVDHRPLPVPGLIHATAHLTGSPGGRQSACVAGPLTCGEVSAGVGNSVSKSAPIAVNSCYQVGVRIPKFATTSRVGSETPTDPSSMPPDDTDVRG